MTNWKIIFFLSFNSYILLKTGFYPDNILISHSLMPLVTYTSPWSIKDLIIKSNKKKCGIYLWTNTKTNDQYVGRSINLGRRFSYYFNQESIKNAGFSLICRALVKYGYEEFKLEILEFCTVDEIVAKEQFWIEKLKPSYNLVTVVDGNYTYTHTAEAKEKMSNFQKARFADPEQKKQLSELHDKWAKSPENIAQLLEAQRIWLSDPENVKKSLPYLKRKKVKVLDLETNIETLYPSFTEAAKAMGCNRTTLNYWLKGNKSKAPIKGRYTIVVTGELELSE